MLGVGLGDVQNGMRGHNVGLREAQYGIRGRVGWD